MNRDDNIPDGPDDSDWPAYPPGMELPDVIPEPLRTMLKQMQDAGGTVRLGPPDESGVGMVSVRGEGNAPIFDGMSGSIQVDENEPATEGHPPHHDCLICRTNRKLEKVYESELNDLEMIEAVSKLLTEAQDEAKKGDDSVMSTALVVQSIEFLAACRNRADLHVWIQERVKELATRAGAMGQALVEGRTPTLEEAKAQIGGDNAEARFDISRDLFQLKDLKKLGEVMRMLPRYKLRGPDSIEDVLQRLRDKGAL